MISQSPKARPSKADLLTFPEAMQAVIKGQKVAREGWENSDYLTLEKPGFLSLHEGNGTVSALLVSDGDMLNDDWIIINHH